MRFTRMLTAAAAAAALLLTAPASASAVMPADRDDDDRGTSTSAFWASATPEQKAAVGAARQAYLGSAWDARVALRKQASSIRATQEAALDAPAKALALAKDAWLFAAQTGGDTTAAKAAYEKAKSDYRTAADAARSAAKAAYESARQTAKTALDQAAATYRAAVIAAFPAGTAIPERVLMPPSSRGGHWGDRGHGRGHR